MDKALGAISKLFDAIWELTKANWRTGKWDNMRNEMRKSKAKEDFTIEDWYTFYGTEVNSRDNVELRAVHRAAINENYQKIIQFYKDNNLQN